MTEIRQRTTLARIEGWSSLGDTPTLGGFIRLRGSPPTGDQIPRDIPDYDFNDLHRIIGGMSEESQDEVGERVNPSAPLTHWREAVLRALKLWEDAP